MIIIFILFQRSLSAVLRYYEDFIDQGDDAKLYEDSLVEFPINYLYKGLQADGYPDDQWEPLPAFNRGYYFQSSPISVLRIAPTTWYNPSEFFYIDTFFSLELWIKPEQTIGNADAMLICKNNAYDSLTYSPATHGVG